MDEKFDEVQAGLKTAEQGAQTEQEAISYRELRDLLMDIPGMNDENLENGGLETQKNYLKEIAEKSSERKAALCRQIIKLCELKEDEIRLRTNQRPETEEVQSIVEDEIQNSTLRRFEKFKEWSTSIQRMVKTTKLLENVNITRKNNYRRNVLSNVRFCPNRTNVSYNCVFDCLVNRKKFFIEKSVTLLTLRIFYCRT